MYERYYGPVTNITLTSDVHSLDVLRQNLKRLYTQMIYFDKTESHIYCCCRLVDREKDYIETKINILREQLAIEKKIKRKVNGTALIMFKNRLDASKAASLVMWTEWPQHFQHQIAPPPDDIIRRNLHYTKKDRRIRQMVATAVDFITIALCAALVVSLKLALKAKQLLFLFGGDDNETIPESVEMLFEYLPLVVLPIVAFLCRFVYQFLPHLQKKVTISENNFLFVQYYHRALIVFVLLWSVTEILVEVLVVGESTTSTLNVLIGDAVIEYSIEIMRYVLSFGLIFQMVELLRLTEIPLTLLSKLATCWCFFPPKYELGLTMWYPYHLIVFCCICAYSIVSPMILLLGVIYFKLAYIVHTYKLLVIYPKGKSLQADAFIDLWGLFAWYSLHLPQIVLLIVLVGKMNLILIPWMFPLLFVTHKFVGDSMQSYQDAFKCICARVAKKCDDYDAPKNQNDEKYLESFENHYDEKTIAEEAASSVYKYLLL